MSKIVPKILLVHSTLHIGGAERVSAYICEKIDRERFDLRVCYLKEKGVIADEIEAKGTPVVGYATGDSKKANYLTFLNLKKIISKYKINIVHSHDSHAFADSAICKMITPSLGHIHTFHFGNYPHRDRGQKRIESVFWRIPDKLVTVSSSQARGLTQLYGIPGSRLTLAWNGVDVGVSGDPLPEIKQAKAEGRIVIGSVNTLIPQKGMFDLIEVANRLKAESRGRYIFVIAGGGPLHSKLEEEVKRRGLQDEVKFVGWVSAATQMVIPYLDIFFQPSLWEAMSMVLLEAMAFGKAIVATKVGETPQLITDHRDGLLVEPGGIDNMVSALRSLIESEDKRIGLGKLARERHRDGLTARCMVERYERLYTDIYEKGLVRS